MQDGEHRTHETADIEGNDRAEGDCGTSAQGGETELEAVAPRRDSGPGPAGDGTENARDRSDGLPSGADVGESSSG